MKQSEFVEMFELATEDTAIKNAYKAFERRYSDFLSGIKAYSEEEALSIKKVTYALEEYLNLDEKNPF